ncbi:hypothetical protein FOZ62_024523 [Perkinsus olseni]|uniref:Uncharacterized protein n=1 Tax=Perkinsus olseni TaxID=32597 RepID=A0A7J6TRP9_PEROL|nr:hypothetical protein FOZ62_024523 [Perkinsus olseni]
MRSPDGKETSPKKDAPSAGHGRTASLNSASEDLQAKLSKVRYRAEQEGQVWTNSPRDRYADSAFDDKILDERGDGPPPFQHWKGDSSPREGRSASSSSPHIRPKADSTVRSLPAAQDGLQTIYSTCTIPRLALSPSPSQTVCCPSCNGHDRVLQPLLRCGVLEEASCSKCGVGVFFNDHSTVAHRCPSCTFTRCVVCWLEDLLAAVRRDPQDTYKFAPATREASNGKASAAPAEASESIIERRLSDLEEECRGRVLQLGRERDKLHAQLMHREGELAKWKQVSADWRQHAKNAEETAVIDRSKTSQLQAQLDAVSRELYEYRQQAEAQISNNAAEAVILQSKIVDQAVELAAMKAMNDELSCHMEVRDQQQLASSSSPSSTSPTSATASKGLKRLWTDLIGADTNFTPSSSSRQREAVRSPPPPARYAFCNMCNEVLELLDDPTVFGHNAAELRPVLMYQLNALVGFGPDSPPDSDGTTTTHNFDLDQYESALSNALAMLNKARASLEHQEAVHARELAVQCEARSRAEQKADRIVQEYEEEFKRWKETVLQQVRRECARYRERLQASRQQKRQSVIGASPGDAEGSAEETLVENEGDLDFLFDELDWTADEKQIDSIAGKRKSSLPPGTPSSQKGAAVDENSEKDFL